LSALPTLLLPKTSSALVGAGAWEVSEIDSGPLSQPLARLTIAAA
jgi:hypothetical protein